MSQGIKNLENEPLEAMLKNQFLSYLLSVYFTLTVTQQWVGKN